MMVAYWAALAAGAAYGLFLNRPEGLLRALAKTLPLALLAVAAWTEGGPWLLVLAFVFSAGGDLALAFRGERFFLAGLTAFLIAHLAYSRLFFLEQDEAWSSGLTILGGAVIVIGLAAGVYQRLRPGLGTMKLPVAVYSGVIAAMAVAALARGPDALLLPGVALFLASDIALAFETFRADAAAVSPRWRAPFIWYAYFIGQALIGAAYLLR